MSPRNRIYPVPIKNHAKELRSYGLSLNEIATKLAAPKNTIQGWVKGIELTEQQKRRLRLKEIIEAAKGRKIAASVCRKSAEDRRQRIQRGIFKYGEMPFKNKDIGKIVCGILYLCEGGKYPATTGVSFGNSDSGIIRLFLKLLRENFNIDESRLKCRIMHRDDQNVDELKLFWSQATGIPLERFYKTYSDKRTKGKPTKKAAYKGVCAIQYCYCDAKIQYELQSIGETIIDGGAGGS